MKYIILAFEGFIYPLAKQLQQEGHEVIITQIRDIKNICIPGETLYEDEKEKERRLAQYTNILKKIDADEFLEQAKTLSHPEEYFVICESNNIFKYAQILKSYGFHGIFPTEEDRRFELDRNKAKDFVRQHYPLLKVAPVHKFYSIAKAQSFLQKSEDIWVLKSQTDDIVTFVPPTNNHIIARKQLYENLELYKEGYEAAGFILEKKIANIIELTPEKIYYDGKPLGMSVMFENKFIGSGNVSYQVTCAADVVFPVSMKSKIHDICFPPIIDSMAQEHKGLFIWDASLLIDQYTGEIYFGEFCPNRFGFNSFLTTLEQMPSCNAYFEAVSQQKNPYPPEKVGASVMLFNLLQDQNGNPQGDIAIDFPKDISNHVWLYDLYRKRDGNYYSIGYDSHLGPVSGSGKNVREAVDRLYSYVEQFSMNNVYYRPKFDWLSKDYPTSLLNRLDYCLQQGLFTVTFSIE